MAQCIWWRFNPNLHEPCPNNCPCCPYIVIIGFVFFLVWGFVCVWLREVVLISLYACSCYSITSFYTFIRVCALHCILFSCTFVNFYQIYVNRQLCFFLFYSSLPTPKKRSILPWSAISGFIRSFCFLLVVSKRLLVVNLSYVELLSYSFLFPFVPVLDAFLAHKIIIILFNDIFAFSDSLIHWKCLSSRKFIHEFIHLLITSFLLFQHFYLLHLY